MKKEIIDSIKTELDLLNIESSDLSDLGNSIGKIIGEIIDDTIGYEKADFISGLNHGISLVDGSHNNPKIQLEPDFNQMYKDAIAEFEKEYGKITQDNQLELIPFVMEYAYYKTL